MEFDWEGADDDAYTGPDGYLEGEEGVLDLENQLMQDDPDVTQERSNEGPPEGDDGLHAQRRSMLELLDSAFISIVPAAQTIQPFTGGGPGARLTSTLTMDQVQLLLAAARSRGRGTWAAMQADDDDDDDDDPDYIPGPDYDDDGNGMYYHPWGVRRPRPRNWFEPVTEPQKAGVELMNSGDFGRLRAVKKMNMYKRMREREMGGFEGRGKGMHKEDFSRHQVPNSNGTIVAMYGSNAYCGQYSADSSFYYTCCQDWRLHIYDTRASFGPSTKVSTRGRAGIRERWTNEVSPGHETTMKSIKTINAVPGSWTITDSHLSPDNERLIYSSITDTVYMTKISEPSSPHIPIRFGNREGYRSSFDLDNFGIYSCRFSADGNEVIAGGNGQHGELRVYDLIANRRTITIDAHGDDVNSCCWADTASGNVLISASDDTFLKVWDRRSLSSSQRPSGVLVGHTEGITYVSAKGDGRYVLSNGKDQSMKLWDLRKMRSNGDFETFEHRHFRQSSYDYRQGYYAKPKYSAHPKDCSVMTYRGHHVFKTLIRCHFSPLETTGGTYLYTGSSDGRIHIYSLDGRIVQILDRGQTLPISFDPSEPDPGAPNSSHRHSQVCVRDVSWHSQEPVLMSVGWEGSQGERSSVARHEWKGMGKLGAGKLEDHVERQKRERAERAQRRAVRRDSTSVRMPGSFDVGDYE